MARSRGLLGLLWSILGLAVILSVADLARGRDSLIRSWWSDLRVTPGEGAGSLLDKFRKDPGSFRR